VATAENYGDCPYFLLANLLSEKPKINQQKCYYIKCSVRENCDPKIPVRFFQ
jgi:hypothetical protein